jgi:hypothetical protein
MVTVGIWQNQLASASTSKSEHVKLVQKHNNATLETTRGTAAMHSYGGSDAFAKGASGPRFL